MKAKAIQEARNLETIIASKTPGGERIVDILMYFDEAHVLTKAHPTGIQSKTLYNIFLSVLSDYVEIHLFVLFLSTALHLAELAPTRAQVASSRAAASGAHQAPITETPFDCSPNILVKQHFYSRRDVADMRFMARFGRPL